MATIQDVAERAGVSVKTVSRVMNDHQHISAKTRTKVEQAMRELNYASAALTKHRKIGESLSIGMLYGDPSSGYQTRLNHAVLKACSDAHRYLVVELFDEVSSEWGRQVEEFMDRTKVQNLLLVPPMCDSSELHTILKKRGANVVLLSPTRPAAGSTAITMDDRLAAKEMTQHLIRLGHKRIGHISGNPMHVASLLRRQGYEEALIQAGIVPDNDNLLKSADFFFKRALDVAKEMLTSPNRPTAIFAANDDMAAAVVMMANRLGLSVPNDLSVAGFDNTAIASTIWPELTTVAQPFDEFARQAVHLLSTENFVEDAISETLVLPHELIIRGSTGPAPTL